jgi:imidazolonepropionase
MEGEQRFLLRFRNANQIVRVAADGDGPFKRTPSQMNELRIIEHGSLVVGLDGRIAAVGTDHEVDSQLGPKVVYENVVDCTGKCLVPGLCDAHTHAVWAGDRVHEFALKLAGATYMEIHAKGGGIGFTVGHTRTASEESLLNLLCGRLDRMLQLGTTLIESKSGYGLETETELKMLRVLHRANKSHDMDIVSNFCGGHSVPKGFVFFFFFFLYNFLNEFSSKFVIVVCVSCISNIVKE